MDFFAIGRIWRSDLQWDCGNYKKMIPVIFAMQLHRRDNGDFLLSMQRTSRRNTQLLTGFNANRRFAIHKFGDLVVDIAIGRIWRSDLPWDWTYKNYYYDCTVRTPCLQYICGIEKIKTRTGGSRYTSLCGLAWDPFNSSVPFGPPCGCCVLSSGRRISFSDPW